MNAHWNEARAKPASREDRAANARDPGPLPADRGPARPRRGWLRRLAAALIAAPLLAGLAGACAAQPRPAGADGPILRLEAQTTREVLEDTAFAVFFVEREGPQPGPLQSAVNAVLEAALADLRSDRALQVRSGGYTTYPRYSREGRIDSWRVRAELVADSGDVAAISRASATLSGRMNVASIGFRLSPQKRAETEKELTGEAAERFYDKARAAARALGFADIELIEANFNTGAPPQPMPMARAMAASAPDAAPVPLEPGRTQVTVTFSGAVRLRR